MGFVKTFEEIMANVKATADFYGAKMLTVFWETKPEIIKKLLPPPLEPADYPLAMAFVADYPATNFDTVYLESALFIRAAYNGEEGSYCLAMPVTSDIAMAGGREVFGFPKKMGEIEMKKENDQVTGWTKRRDIRFMEIRARLTSEFNDPQAKQMLLDTGLAEGSSTSAIAYNFKHFPAPEGGTFDYDPRLVRQETIFKPKVMKLGEAEIILTPSDYDPWAEVEVIKPLGAIYTEGDNSMVAAKVVDEVDPMEFAPYAFLKWDMI